MTDDRYHPAVLERLLFEAEVEGETATFVFLCVVTNRELAVDWPCPEGAELADVLVEAFRSVEDEFFWDGDRWLAWDANDQVTSFVELLDGEELRRFDNRVLLARALQEVLAADGRVADEERALFAQLCPEFGETAELPPPRGEDFDHLSRRAREAVYAFCCAMAMCDFELDPAEEGVLERLASSLGLVSLRAWALRDAARRYLVDRMLDSDEVERRATALGLGPEALEKLAERRRLRQLHKEAPASDGELPEVIEDWLSRFF